MTPPINFSPEGPPETVLPDPDTGVVAFPRLLGHEDTEPLCERLRTDFDTGIVPGRFFGDPTRVRLAFGVEHEALAAALTALGRALDG